MRSINVNTLFQKKFSLFEFDGTWKSILGQPSRGGFWIIIGPEKNGKTTFALKLADYLSKHEKVLYVSAEEGLDKEFKEAVMRARIDPHNKNLLFTEYIELSELEEKTAKRHAPKIAIIDNITVYVNELKNGALRKLQIDHPNTTFIFLAHEEKNEPYTATAKLCKKLAKIIVHIKGLTAFISGRCPGGEIIIDEDKAMLFHGSEILKNKS
jgi:adenosyl cobinamide kinase/adenosyl cobinamide phosphate guanylyltransferase